MLQVVPKLCRKEDCLGRNAAPEEAGSTETVVCINQSGLQAILRGADRAGISGRTAAENHYIKNCICQGNTPGEGSNTIHFIRFLRRSLDSSLTDGSLATI